MARLAFEEVLPIGKNREYVFGVGLLGKRWMGFAEGGGMLFLFPEISEKGYLGLPDKTRAILLTGAIAQADESGYGGIAQWLVAPELRGDPESFRCLKCFLVGCDGACEEEDDGAY